MTNLTEINEIFLSKISDFRFLRMTNEQIEETLYNYFRSARAKFYRCKKNLTVEDKVIQDELTYFEIEILANLMLVEYITPQLVSGENMRQSLSDKDFKIYSQANQLREIRLLLGSIEKKANKMILDYTFFGLEQEKM